MSEILRMKGITKIYPNGVIANKNVNLEVKEGEIHALMGENGAGKSTLMKILFGFEKADSGTVEYMGKNIKINSPDEAIKEGIGMVSQHFMLVDKLKVYENVILGMEPTSYFFIDKEKSIKLVNEYSEKFNLKINSLDLVEILSVGKKQKVEILKVLTRGSKLIILDEPTAVLTPQETFELFEQLKLLKQNGYTIIFITHKIQEVMSICDRITVLRKGMNVGTIDVKDSTPESISKMMVGRDVILKIQKKEKTQGEDLLDVSNLKVLNSDGIIAVDDVTFKLKKGEIVGIAGVEGNGQSELANAIFGMLELTDGKIKINGTDISSMSIKEKRKCGIAYIPEDRIHTGTSSFLSIWENVISNKIDEIESNFLGYINLHEVKKEIDEIVEKFSIVSKNVNQEIGMLSGGNIQKAVIARELSSNPIFLIANQPTRGVDVGAQEFIWTELVDFSEKGNTILLISADLNELLELSDRILVMNKGKIVANLDNRNKIDEEELGLYMLGVKAQDMEEINER